jgi:hypothetical protein
MITPIPFVPTPRLEYTEAYNQMQSDYEYFLLITQRKKSEDEDIRLKEYQKEQAKQEKAMLDRILEDNLRYMALAKVKGYYDYKYAYWAGTLVDMYI